MMGGKNGINNKIWTMKTKRQPTTLNFNTQNTLQQRSITQKMLQKNQWVSMKNQIRPGFETTRRYCYDSVLDKEGLPRNVCQDSSLAV